MYNLLKDFDKHITNHIIKVNFLLKHNWIYNEYGNYWFNSNFKKAYMEKIDSFYTRISYLYCSNKGECQFYSLDEAYKVQNKKNNNFNSQQLEFNFTDNEDFEVGLYEELNAIYGVK